MIGPSLVIYAPMIGLSIYNFGLWRIRRRGNLLPFPTLFLLHILALICLVLFLVLTLLFIFLAGFGITLEIG